MQQDLPSCNNITTATTPTPMNQNQYPSKPLARRPPPSLPSKLSKPSTLRDEHVIKSLHDDDDHHDHVHVAIGSSSSASASVSSSSSVLVGRRDGSSDDGNGRERLKRHREDVAGRVVIPDKWGKEELLKDWMDYSSFDSLLAPTGLASARQALMAEGRRTSSHQRLRIQSMC